MKAFDAVVVGSGFGGAVAACRLAERGRSVLVLERGRRWDRRDFPRPGQAQAPWRFQQVPGASAQTGLFEVRRFQGMKVIVAAGVGGGSLVYTNVQKIPPASALAGWPEPLTLEYLRPYYQRVAEMLEPTPIPQSLQRIHAFQSSHAAAGRLPGVELPPLAIRWGEGDEETVNRFGARQAPCNLCGQCVLGCDRHAKNTLDLTYLKRAEILGADIWPLCQVIRLAPREEGYEISFRRLQASGETPQELEKVYGRSLYLAAGSLGTTQLLLRSRDLDATLPRLSPRLGQGWSANGDFFAALLDSRTPILPAVGPSVAAAYDAAASEGFYVLEGSIPAAVVTARKAWLRLAAGLASLLRFSWLRKRARTAQPLFERSCGDPELEQALGYMGVFFLMGRDASDGRLRLGARGQLELDWDPRQSELLLGRMRRYLEELAAGYGGWLLAPQPWWPVESAGTVHPLGGCAMGRDAAQAVVDPFGRVFGYPNLFVCDGSVFPRALGVPPSMTIAALAEHIAEQALSSGASRGAAAIFSRNAGG